MIVIILIKNGIIIFFVLFCLLLLMYVVSFPLFDEIWMIFVVSGLLVKNSGYVEKFWMDKLISESIP